MDQTINANYIKTLLIDLLLNGNKDIELIASEVPYLFGYRRADLIAIINNQTIAFEIKSELDNLNKLEEQVNDYIDVFNKVYIVLAEKFKNNDLIKKIPQNIGIIYLLKNNELKMYRQAKGRKLLVKDKLVYFFKKNDMISYTEINPKLSLRKTREIFLRNNSIRSIMKRVQKILKDRYSKKYRTFLNERGRHTVNEDLILLTGINTNNQILQNS